MQAACPISVLRCWTQWDMCRTSSYLKILVGCGSPACRKSCHHAVWILHVFRFSRNEQLIYKKKLSKGEWEKVLSAFPGQLPLARLPAVANPTYSINICLTNREAKCAVCKKTLVHGDLQASTEGPYRTIERK